MKIVVGGAALVELFALEGVPGASMTDAGITVLHLFAGKEKAKSVSPVMYVLAVMFLVKYFLL